MEYDFSKETEEEIIPLLKEIQKVARKHHLPLLICVNYKSREKEGGENCINAHSYFPDRDPEFQQIMALAESILIGNVMVAQMPGQEDVFFLKVVTKETEKTDKP